MSKQLVVVGGIGALLAVGCQEPAKSDAKSEKSDAKSEKTDAKSEKTEKIETANTETAEASKPMSRRAAHAHRLLVGSDPALAKCKAALESVGSREAVDGALGQLGSSIDKGTFASTTALADLNAAYGSELPLSAAELDTCVQTFAAQRKLSDPSEKPATSDIDCPGGTLCQCDTGPICCSSGEDCACSCDDEGGICTPYCECFPGSARVRRADGALVRMRDLGIGDRVEVMREDGTLGFEAIYLFTHNDREADGRFVALRLASGETLAATARHFVPIGTPGATWSNHQLIAFDEVRPGHCVWTRGELGRPRLVEVVEVVARRDQGLFNPLTPSGTIVVEGVVASAHSDWFLDGFASPQVQGRVYQAMFAPVRGLYRVLGPKLAITIAEDWGVVERLREGSTALQRRVLALVERGPRRLAARA